MKLFYTPILLLLLASCNHKEKTTNPIAKSSKSETTITKTTESSSDQKYTSILRPNEELKLEQVYTDNVEFVDFNDDGDYFLMTVKKGNESTSVVYNSRENLNFLRGDLIELEWKMDSIYIAGDGERLDFSEWLVKAKKVKDGNVSLFRKKYKKPIKFYSEENNLTDGYKDYVYSVVEFYLANSKQELVKSNLKNPDLDLVYSVEDGEKNGRSYTIIRISNDFEHHTNIIQSLYLDNENRKLYEYDLANDKLIEFN